MARVVEFCCGYGGATAGMLAAGLDIEASYDLWPVAVKAHQEWHPETPCSMRDISTVTAEELRGRLVWASLPCQPYSTANRYPEKRGKKHPHYYSLAAFARQVQHARVALIENVPGLLWSKEGRAEMGELERECNRLGLGMSVHLVFSHWFGVQQWRRRAFILIGHDLPLVLIQTGNSSAPDAMSAAVQATHGGVNGSLNRKAAFPLGENVRARLNASVTCDDGGDNIHSSKKKALSRAVNTRRQGTPTKHSASSGAGRSIEKCAELQGVPVPDARLSKSDRYTLIGNAVPPLLAESIARQVFLPLLSGSQ